MKKKFYILMCLASLVLMVTACGGKEKIKEKLRGRKGAEGSGRLRKGERSGNG